MITETWIAGRGPLYFLDPRPKLIMLIAFTLFFLIESSLYLQALMLAVVLILIAVSLGPKRILVPVRSILPILIITAVLTPPFHTAGRVLLSIGGRSLATEEGLRLTAALLLRFTGITSTFYLFFSTTQTEPMILALRSFGLPYRAALTVTISLRYIPDMFKVYHRISDAHKLRTAGIPGRRASSGFRYRLRNLFPVLTSVLIHAVKSIPALAMALDSKGLGRSNPRTSCRSLPPVRSIAIQILLTALLLAVMVCLSVLL